MKITIYSKNNIWTSHGFCRATSRKELLITRTKLMDLVISATNQSLDKIVSLLLQCNTGKAMLQHWSTTMMSKKLLSVLLHQELQREFVSIKLELQLCNLPFLVEPNASNRKRTSVPAAKSLLLVSRLPFYCTKMTIRTTMPNNGKKKSSKETLKHSIKLLEVVITTT